MAEREYDPFRLLSLSRLLILLHRHVDTDATASAVECPPSDRLGETCAGETNGGRERRPRRLCACSSAALWFCTSGLRPVPPRRWIRMPDMSCRKPCP